MGVKLQRKWEEELKILGEIGLPDSLEWADKNLPVARSYIENIYSEAVKAVIFDDKNSFNIALEKYTKAWLRLWQKMAEEHFGTRDMLEVDMRYFRHLPDGYSMTLDSSAFGKKFIVLPRKPKKPPVELPWITAGEMIKIHENPILFSMLKDFDGWFDRDAESREKSILQRAIEDEKKNPPPVKLKMNRRDKHGVEWYK